MGLTNPVHIAILVVVIVLVFGAKRLPALGRQVGGGIREVKSAVGLDEMTATATETRRAITAGTSAEAPDPADGDKGATR